MNRKISFSHLLLTRFNIDYSRRGGSAYICDEEWHRERFELFNEFCLPSVANQTCRQFEWIIFFNEEERDKYQPLLEEIQQAMENIRFFYIRPTDDHRESLHEYISRHITADYLITTRIDNDDSISGQFVECIQEKFREHQHAIDENHFIINPGNGYQFETKFPYRKALIRNYPFSPFISLSSKRIDSKPFRTVLEQKHNRWVQFSDFEELSEQPLWAQIIHHKNRANRVLSLQLLPKISDDNFPELLNSPKNNFWFGLFLLPLQYLTTAVQRIIEKVKKMLR